MAEEHPTVSLPATAEDFSFPDVPDELLPAEPTEQAEHAERTEQKTPINAPNVTNSLPTDPPLPTIAPELTEVHDVWCCVACVPSVRFFWCVCACLPVCVCACLQCVREAARFCAQSSPLFSDAFGATTASQERMGILLRSDIPNSLSRVLSLLGFFCQTHELKPHSGAPDATGDARAPAPAPMPPRVPSPPKPKPASANMPPSQSNQVPAFPPSQLLSSQDMDLHLSLPYPSQVRMPVYVCVCMLLLRFCSCVPFVYVHSVCASASSLCECSPVFSFLMRSHVGVCSAWFIASSVCTAHTSSGSIPFWPLRSASSHSLSLSVSSSLPGCACWYQ